MDLVILFVSVMSSVPEVSGALEQTNNKILYSNTQYFIVLNIYM